MFSFRNDKVGFFSGLTLMIVCGGTLTATLILLIVGWARGDVMFYIGGPIKWVVFGWWIACIATVLIRVYILDWQLKKRLPHTDSSEEQSIAPNDGSSGMPARVDKSEKSR
ncbi:MAG: hypothetical protein ACRD36_01875 [Candidatus Acidiferrum sp.]